MVVFFDGSRSPLRLSLTYGSEVPNKSIFESFKALTTFTCSIPTGFFVAALHKKIEVIW